MKKKMDKTEDPVGCTLWFYVKKPNWGKRGNKVTQELNLRWPESHIFGLELMVIGKQHDLDVYCAKAIKLGWKRGFNVQV